MTERIRLRTARPLTRKELAEKYAVSIVIPVRNSSGLLGQCLAGLARNDLTNTEICVVDDGSSEDIRTLVQASEIADRTQVLRLDETRGPAGARNAGFRVTSHPHVFFLDADVVLAAETLDYIRDSVHLYSHRPEVIGVLGGYAEEIPSEDFWSNYKNLSTVYLYKVTDAVTPFLHTPIFCVRRTVLEENGGFRSDRRTAEDFRLGIQLGTQGYRSVIDRRIRGVHLKSYALAGVLREDRQRIQDMAGLRLSVPEREFSYRAHRVNRILSVLLPLPILVLLGLSVWNPLLFKSAVLLALIFVLANGPFLRYLAARRGVRFAAGGLAALFVEMLWGELCLARAALLPGRSPAPPKRLDRLPSIPEN